MVDSNPIKCSNLKIDEVMEKIKDLLVDIKPKEKTVRINLDDISNHVYRGIDFRELQKLSNEATHLEINANIVKNGESNTPKSYRIDSLMREFEKFLQSQEIEDKETMLELGLAYIEKVQTRDEDK